MTKEQLEDRIKELQLEMEKYKALALMCDGAIQDCNHWLQQLKPKGK